MPPPGGFESVKYKRNLPFRGPGSLAILGGVTAICAYGFYRLGKGNLEKRQVPSIDSVVSAGCETCLVVPPLNAKRGPPLDPAACCDCSYQSLGLLPSVRKRNAN